MARRKPVHLQPAGVHVDALHEIRKAMRALRRAEARIMARIRADKRAAERKFARFEAAMRSARESDVLPGARLGDHGCDI